MYGDQNSVSTNTLQDRISQGEESSAVNANTSLGDVSKSLSTCSHASRHQEIKSKVMCNIENGEFNLNADDTRPTGPNILKVFSLNGDVANNPDLSNNDMSTNITMNNNITGNSCGNTSQDAAIENTHKIEIPDVVIVNDAMSSNESTSVLGKDFIKDNLSTSKQKNICNESGESVGITLNSGGYQLTTVNNLPPSTNPTYILSNMHAGNIVTPNGSPYSFIMSAPINGVSVPVSAFPSIVQSPMPTVVPKPATSSIKNEPGIQPCETSQTQGNNDFLF